MSAKQKNMVFEVQSDARVWVHLGGADASNPSPLKLTMPDVARLYRCLGAVLRDYSSRSADILAALGDEGEIAP